MEYLIRFAQTHESFRRPEIEALASLLDIDIEFLFYDRYVCSFFSCFHLWIDKVSSLFFLFYFLVYIEFAPPADFLSPTLNLSIRLTNAYSHPMLL